MNENLYTHTTQEFQDLLIPLGYTFATPYGGIGFKTIGTTEIQARSDGSVWASGSKIAVGYCTSEFLAAITEVESQIS